MQKIKVFLFETIILLLFSCATTQSNPIHTDSMKKVLDFVKDEEYERAKAVLNHIPSTNDNKDDMIYYEVRDTHQKFVTSFYPRRVISRYIDKIKEWTSSIYETCELSASNNREIEKEIECYTKREPAYHLVSSGQFHHRYPSIEGDYDENIEFNQNTYEKKSDFRCYKGAAEQTSENDACNPFGCLMVAEYNSENSFYSFCGGIAFVKMVSNKRITTLNNILEKLTEAELDIDKKYGYFERESGKVISDIACLYNNKISTAQMVTNSGSINKETLYQAGVLIQVFTTNLNEQKKEYKKKTGKEWTLQLCK